MTDELNKRLIDSAEKNIEYVDKLYEIFQQVENDGKSRLIWLVAISGFALINVPIAMSYKSPSIPIIYIILPWLFTAILGVVTHWQYRNRMVSTISHYTTKRELLMAYITNGIESATMANLNDILANNTEPLPKIFKKQISDMKLVERLELITMLLFISSVAITIFTYT